MARVKQLTSAELRRLIKAHNKLVSINIPVGTKKEGLIKLIEDNGYKVDHENKKLVPNNATRSNPTVDLPPAPPRRTKEEVAEAKKKREMKKTEERRKIEAEGIKKADALRKILQKKKTSKLKKEAEKLKEMIKEKPAEKKKENGVPKKKEKEAPKKKEKKPKGKFTLNEEATFLQLEKDLKIGNKIREALKNVDTSADARKFVKQQINMYRNEFDGTSNWKSLQESFYKRALRIYNKKIKK